MIDTKQILADVRKNMAALDACAGPHDFSIDATPQKPLFKKWRCSKCGGVVEQQCRLWYERGLKHWKT